MSDLDWKSKRIQRYCKKHGIDLQADLALERVVDELTDLLDTLEGAEGDFEAAAEDAGMWKE